MKASLFRSVTFTFCAKTLNQQFEKYYFFHANNSLQKIHPVFKGLNTADVDLTWCSVWGKIQQYTGISDATSAINKVR